MPEIPGPTEAHDEPRRVDSSIGRFLRRLAKDETVTLRDIATQARIPLAQLEACRDGLKRLSPDKQMRVAAVVVTIAPAHARIAHALYAQAQTELRFTARQVESHTDYPGREAMRGASPRDLQRKKVLEDAWTRSAEAITRAGALRAASEELCAEASRLVAERSRISDESVQLMRDKVEGLARLLRQSGAPPERALVLVKRAVEALVSGPPPLAGPVMDRVVEWFVEAYFAA